MTGTETVGPEPSGGLPQVVILAGGLGTRLGARTNKTPKPLITVAGHPFVWHQLRLLAEHGAGEILLCVGHLGELIEAEIGNQVHGLHLSYSYDQPGLDGTLGALRRADGLLEDRFLVLYGDTYLRIDYQDAATSWQASGLPAMMTVLANANRWGASNAHYRDGRVIAYDKFTPSPAMTFIDYGLLAFTKDTVVHSPSEESDLAQLCSDLASASLLFGYEAHERFYEIGTPEALAETEQFLLRVEARQ